MSNTAFSRLPKPVRFGLFGAVGGLLGALLVGELAWSLLEPPPPAAPPPPPPRLAVTSSPSVEAFQGGTNKFSVGFDSDQMDEATIDVSFVGLPAGATIAPVTGIKRGEREAVVSLADSTPPGTYPLTGTASATVSGVAVKATTTTSLRVDPRPIPWVDVVFVIDISASMQWAVDGASRGAQRFAAELNAAKIDARFAAVVFTHYKYERNHTLALQFATGEFTTDAEEFRRHVSVLRAGGGASPGESSLDGTAAAAGLPFRPKATKVVLLITDEPPCIPDGRMQSVKDTVDVLRNAKVDQLHLVVRSNEAFHFEGLRTAFKGDTFDLNGVVQGDGFEKLMPELSRVIATSTPAVRPSDVKLSAPPPPPTLSATQGLQSSREYDSSSGGRLLAAISCWTAAIAAGISVALATMQFLSLNRRPSVSAVLLSLAGGLVAGLIGGAVGQGLFALAAGNSTIGLVFRVVGWSALGALAGAGLAFVVPNLRKQHGLVGGVLGGGLGAAGYLMVSGAGLGDTAGRLAGAVILGFCIGLMVALVEAAFRRAWLDVRFSGGEVIRVNLGPEPVKVGDDRGCTVWARGAPPVALRYWVRDGRVVCHDVASGAPEGLVADGDVRRAGAVVVTVRTAAGPAPALTKPGPKPPRPRVVDATPLELPPLELPPPPPPPRAAAPPVAPPRPIPPPAPPRPVAPPQVAAPPVVRAAPPKPVAAPPAPPKPAAKPAFTCGECGASFEKKMTVCPKCGAMA